MKLTEKEYYFIEFEKIIKRNPKPFKIIKTEYTNICNHFSFIFINCETLIFQTRAKSGLIVFGDADTLKAGDKHWNAFVNWSEAVDCFMDTSLVEDSV